MFKKLIIASLFFSLLFGFVGVIGAEEASDSDPLIVTSNEIALEETVTETITTEPSELVGPGIAPDNFFYPFKLFFENVGTAFTFGNLAKAKRYANLAEKRMAEAQIMIGEGKEKIAERTLNRYQELLDGSLDRSQRASEKGKDPSEIQEKISRITENHLLVLDKVLEQVPEQAQVAVQQARNISHSRQIQALTGLLETSPQKADQISKEILDRRVVWIKEKIAINDDEGAESKLAEWEEHANFLEAIQEKKEELSSIIADGLEKGLKDLDGIREQARGSSSRLQEVVQEVRNRAAGNQEKFFETLKEVNLEEAAILLDEAAEGSFTNLIGEITGLGGMMSSSVVTNLETITRLEMKEMGDWIKANGLNQYGDLMGTIYTGGTPLFDELTGEEIDRIGYILKQHPNRPWQRIAKEEKVQEALREHERYIGLWEGITNQIEAGREDLLEREETEIETEAERSELIYKLNNERLEELNNLYEKISGEDKETIEGMMRISERERQRIEQGNPQLLLTPEYRGNILVPQQIRQEVKIQLRNEEAAKVRAGRDEAGNPEAGSSSTTVSPEETKGSDSKGGAGKN